MPTTPLPAAIDAATFAPPVTPPAQVEPALESPRQAPREAPRRDALWWLVAAVLAVGVALRLWAWWARGTMWMDEIAVARNVQERTLWQLLALPLDYMQAAPKGFLLLEWLTTRVFGESARALRIVPLAASLWSLWLFRDVARRLLTPAGALVALLFVAVGPQFLFQAAEVKPYTIDVAVAMLLVREALAWRDGEHEPGGWRRLALVGFAVVWFSQFAVLVLAGLGLAMALTMPVALGAREAIRRLAPLGLAWGATAALAAWVAIASMSPATADYMRWFHEANMPPQPMVWAKLPAWFLTRVRMALGAWHGFNTPGDDRWRTLFPALALVGAIALLVRRRGAGMYVLMPVLVTIVAVIAHQYPLANRLVLVPIAFLLLWVGESASRLVEVPWRAARVVGAVLVAGLCALPALRTVAFPPPYNVQQMGSILGAARAAWRPGDVLWIPFGHAMAARYYASAYGFRPEDIRYAPCTTRSPKPAWEAIDALRGRSRVIVMRSNGPLQLQDDFRYFLALGVREDSLPIDFVGSIGARPRQNYDEPTLWVFDLSDSTKLARTSAATFKRSPIKRKGIFAKQSVDPKWCQGVFAPERREQRLGSPLATSAGRDQ